MQDCTYANRQLRLALQARLWHTTCTQLATSIYVGPFMYAERKQAWYIRKTRATIPSLWPQALVEQAPAWSHRQSTSCSTSYIVGLATSRAADGEA